LSKWPFSNAILLFDCLQVTDPEELEKIRDREADITKERIQKILNAGANVILTTGISTQLF
jgi:hypothetical protein